MKFKVGDIVKVSSLRCHDPDFAVGEEFKIIKVYESPEIGESWYYRYVSGDGSGLYCYEDELELVKSIKQAIDTSGKYVRAVYELVDLSIKGENFTLDMGEIKELIKELQELV